MVLPMTDIVGLLQQGVRRLLRRAGLALMSLTPPNGELEDIRFHCFTVLSRFDQAGGSRFSLLGFGPEYLAHHSGEIP
jgi:hypothetical protein